MIRNSFTSKSGDEKNKQKKRVLMEIQAEMQCFTGLATYSYS